MICFSASSNLRRSFRGLTMTSTIMADTTIATTTATTPVVEAPTKKEVAEETTGSVDDIASSVEAMSMMTDDKLNDLLNGKKADDEEGDEKQEEEAAAALPPPPKPTISLMDLLNGAVATASNATADSAAYSKTLETRQRSQRRKSRELEEMAFGMDLKKRIDLKTAFEEIDTDKSGTIEVCELRECLKKSRTSVPSDAELKEAIAKFDKDNDGSLSFEEFQMMVSSFG